jgi:hypothetical protein
VGGIWGTEPNGDTYLRVGLELSPENGTRLDLAYNGLCSNAFYNFLVRPTCTEHGLTGRRRTRHRHGLG